MASPTGAAFSSVIATTSLASGFVATGLVVLVYGAIALFGIGWLSTAQSWLGKPPSEKQVRADVLDAFEKTALSSSSKLWEFVLGMLDPVIDRAVSYAKARIAAHQIRTLAEPLGDRSHLAILNARYTLLHLRQHLNTLKSRLFAQVHPDAPPAYRADSCAVCYRSIDVCAHLCRRCSGLHSSSQCPMCVREARHGCSLELQQTLAQMAGFPFDLGVASSQSLLVTASAKIIERVLPTFFSHYESSIDKFSAWLTARYPFTTETTLNNLNEALSCLRFFSARLLARIQTDPRMALPLSSLSSVDTHLQAQISQKTKNLIMRMARRLHKQADTDFFNSLDFTLAQLRQFLPKPEKWDLTLLKEAAEMLKLLDTATAPYSAYVTISDAWNLMLASIQGSSDDKIAADFIWNGIIYVLAMGRPSNMISGFAMARACPSYSEIENSQLLQVYAMFIEGNSAANIIRDALEEEERKPEHPAK